VGKIAPASSAAARPHVQMMRVVVVTGSDVAWW